MFLLLAIPIISFAQEEVRWDYPVKPGSEEWKSLSTYQERINVYNIPQDILKLISTKELIITCLNYPEFRLIFTRNDLQRGYNHIRANFNGFRELELRSYAGKELLKIYKDYNPEGYEKNASLLEIGGHVVRFTYIEILLAQIDILNSLNDNDTRELLLQCENIYLGKKKQIEHFGIIGLQTTALIVARSQKEALTETISKFGVNNYNMFIENVILTESALIDEIMNDYKTKSNE